ncbi:MAG TPA: porin [Pseudomonas sp.]|nr:porin [Pseudomonas sp.]
MQKKIIALAVAGLVSGAAFAQSNVTIYGVADVFYGYAWDNYADHTKSGSVVGSGALNGSRLGFKGTEDLGNGLSANFRMEAGVNMDTGTSAQNGGLMSRWATVGLSGKSWGEIQAGRRDTFQDELLGGTDANARSMVSQVSPVYLDQARYNNFVAYLSPNWSGFQVKLGFASNGTDNAANDVVPTEITAAAQNTAANTNMRVYTAAVHYNNGPLVIGAVYDYDSYQDRSSNVAGVAGNGSYDSGNVWNIAGAYDFGVVRLHGAYGMINYADNPQFGEDRDSRTQWSLGLSAPIGANGKLALVYADAKIEYIAAGAGDDKLSLWGISYIHNLSKRTAFYGAYGNLSQDDTFTNGAYRAGLSGTQGTAGSNGYEQGIQVGVRHFF